MVEESKNSPADRLPSQILQSDVQLSVNGSNSPGTEEGVIIVLYV